MSDLSYPISRGAYDFAQDAGIERMASMGAGEEFINSMIRARMATVRPKIAEARFGAGFNTMQRLGEHTKSGQFGTARAAVESYGFGQYANAIMEAEGANEQIRSSASNQWLGVLTDLDSRRDQSKAQKRQFDEAEGNWFDRALGVAALFV